MTRLERTQSALIKKIIEEEVTHPRIGTVTQVFEHAASDDDSNWEVSVSLNGGTGQEKRIPVHTPGSDTIAPPKVGDRVLLIYTDGRSKRPVAMGTGWTNNDRPPLGRAGIYRNRFESGDTDAGSGDLHITGYTEYDEAVSSNEKDSVNPVETMVQLAKHAEGENVTPSAANDLPVKVELYDSADTGDSWVTVEINKVGGANSTATWGMKFNISTGEFKLLDGSGYGIVSDGSGNFTWNYESIDYSQGTTDSL